MTAPTDATSLRRGLAIMRAIEDEEALGAPPPGVTRIAVLIGNDKSQVSRSLKILAEDGLVDRDPETLGYRLGWRLLAMAGRSSRASLVAAAAPLLKRLVRETGERAHLSVLRGTAVLTVLSEGSGHTVQALGWVGRSVPVHSTSSGRALLFDHTEEELAELAGGRRSTEQRGDLREPCAVSTSGSRLRARAGLPSSRRSSRPGSSPSRHRSATSAAGLWPR